MRAKATVKISVRCSKCGTIREMDASLIDALDHDGDDILVVSEGDFERTLRVDWQWQPSSHPDRWGMWEHKECP